MIERFGSARGALLSALLVGLSAPALPLMAQAAPTPPAPVADLPLPDGDSLTLEFIDKALRDGRLKAAADLLTRARLRGDSAELRLREAELLLASGLRTEAEMAFQPLEAEPALAARAKTGRAVALIRGGRSTEAEELLLTAVRLDSGLARAWSTLAVLSDARRNWAEAEQRYAKALAAAPGDAVVYNNRGYSRLLQSRAAEAEPDFLKALELQPGLAAAETNLRLARGLQGHYTEAFSGSSREQLGRDLNTVGFAALVRGDYKLAEGYFSRAIELDPSYQGTAAANLAYVKELQQVQDAQKQAAVDSKSDKARPKP